MSVFAKRSRNCLLFLVGDVLEAAHQGEQQGRQPGWSRFRRIGQEQAHRQLRNSPLQEVIFLSLKLGFLIFFMGNMMTYPQYNELESLIDLMNGSN